MTTYHRESDGPMDLATRFTHWGKAALVAAALLGGGYTVVAKTVTTVQAGPLAQVKADLLEIRVTRLEQQSRFVVKGIEKLTRTKYAPDQD